MWQTPQLLLSTLYFTAGKQRQLLTEPPVTIVNCEQHIHDTNQFYMHEH